jgi:hypothetical protein
MAERPLLLAQLLKLFDEDGVLPERPSEVYERMLNLLLEQWDKERRIRRGSKYSGFTPDRKAKFLAALSYHLTVRIRTTVFSEKILIEAYAHIYKHFGLPADEAKAVAKELESHNGVIVQGSRTEYEFSHLSFQEYLCAEYLVRDSCPERLTEYLKRYPDPIAVAVAISSNPTHWLGSLFLRKNVMVNFTVPSLGAFVARFLVERPAFERTPILGLVAVKLFWGFDEDESVNELLDRFVAMDEVYLSIGDVLEQCYSAVCFLRERVLLKRISHFENEYGLQTQENIVFPRQRVERVLDNLHVKLRCKPEFGSSWISSSSKDLSALPYTDL